MKVRHTKSHRDRLVPIRPGTVDAIQKWLQARSTVRFKDKDESYLFINSDGSQPLHPKPLQTKLKSVGKKCGIPFTVTPHLFRHSIATYLISQGFALEYLMRMLGHANILITQRYLHSTIDDIQSSYQKIDL